MYRSIQTLNPGRGYSFDMRVPKACWICGWAVKLEDCTIDEHGLAVHEKCYVARIMLALARSAQAESRSAVPGFQAAP
jgi:hypothetical protein